MEPDESGAGRPPRHRYLAAVGQFDDIVTHSVPDGPHALGLRRSLASSVVRADPV